MIKGPKSATKVLNGQRLITGWPWTPPTTLLGKSCLALMEEENREQAAELRSIIQEPLSHAAVLQYALAFAAAAEKCLEACRENSLSSSSRGKPESGLHASPVSDILSVQTGSDDPFGHEDLGFKLKWEALRSYTLDLIDGPLLNLHLWTNGLATIDEDETKQEDRKKEKMKESEQSSRSGRAKRKEKAIIKRENRRPTRELMLLWMERMKSGLDVIKITFGPEWMYIWMLNEYGRALNARLYAEGILGKHVKGMATLVPVSHKEGHSYRDPSTQPIPLLAWKHNMTRNREGIFGDRLEYRPSSNGNSTRSRSFTLPNDLGNHDSDDEPLEVTTNQRCSEYVTPFETEQDLLRPKYVSGRSISCGSRNDKYGESLKAVSESIDSLKQLRRELAELSFKMNNETQVAPNLKPPLESFESPSSAKMRDELALDRIKLHSSLKQSSILPPLELNDAPASPPLVTMKAQKESSGTCPSTYTTPKPFVAGVDDCHGRTDQSPTANHGEGESHCCKSDTAHDENTVIDRCSTTKPTVKGRVEIASTSEITKANNSSLAPSFQSSPRLTSPQSELFRLEPLSQDCGQGRAPGIPRSSLRRACSADYCAPPRGVFITPLQSKKSRADRSAEASARSSKTVAPKWRPKYEGNTITTSLLERLLRVKGPDDVGISQTIITELCINLWMILDVGNVWTAMALKLLACDRLACQLVFEELDALQREYGEEILSPAALKKMKHLDSLLYESIRLTPPFLGGLKTTTKTVDIDDAEIQVCKGSHVFFCQPTDAKFDIERALGKRPHTLGKRYPCVELFGFLPLQGLEVPLMVLQSKIFLIVALQCYEPQIAKRKTFIRRVKNAVSEIGFSRQKMQNRERSEETDGNDSSSVDVSTISDLEDQCCIGPDVSPQEAMRLFTKIPFPEPKRVIHLRRRNSDWP